MPSILIVASDHQLCVRIRDILQSPGLTVRDSITAAQGLKTIQMEKPNLIIAQEKVGAMSIEEFIAGIKKSSRDTSFLILLEFHSMEKALRLMKLGAYDCLEPSFEPITLISVVNKVLGRADAGISMTGGKKLFWWKNKWVGIGAVSFLLLIFAGMFILIRQQEKERMRREKQELSSEKEFMLPYPHPSGISFDGEHLWICDWFTQSLYRHKQSDFEILSVHHFSDLNPVAVAWSGSILWVVSADGRIQKHALDEKLTMLQSGKSQDSAPTGIAHDGNYLWVAGGNSKKIFKHLPDQKLTVVGEFLYPGDSPVGLFWDGKSLWSVDGMRRALLKHQVDGNRLLIVEVKQFSEYRDPNFKLVSATFDGQRFWSLAESPSRVIRHALQ